MEIRQTKLLKNMKLSIIMNDNKSWTHSLLSSSKSGFSDAPLLQPKVKKNIQRNLLRIFEENQSNQSLPSTFYSLSAPRYAFSPLYSPTHVRSLGTRSLSQLTGSTMFHWWKSFKSLHLKLELDASWWCSRSMNPTFSLGFINLSSNFKLEFVQQKIVKGREALKGREGLKGCSNWICPLPPPNSVSNDCLSDFPASQTAASNCN